MGNWEISMGFYPGILFGIRSYVEKDFVEHVLYLPFVDFSILIERNG